MSPGPYRKILHFRQKSPRGGSLNKQNVKATPGVLAAKVRDFGSNLLKCSREQIGTKPC